MTTPQNELEPGSGRVGPSVAIWAAEVLEVAAVKVNDVLTPQDKLDVQELIRRLRKHEIT